jgi:hypothetical protein
MQRTRGIGIVILLVIGANCWSACSGVSSHSSASIAQPGPLNASTLPPDASADSQLPVLPPDPAGQSRVLTDYLKGHDLPLVGASMVTGQSGRQLTLYGYVATEQGKSGAENDVRRILKDADVTIVNRIVVKPELLAMTQSNSSGNTGNNGNTANTGNSAASLPGVAQYENYSSVNPAYTSSQIQQYQAHQQGQADWTSWIIPAIMIGLMFVP